MGVVMVKEKKYGITFKASTPEKLNSHLKNLKLDDLIKYVKVTRIPNGYKFTSPWFDGKVVLENTEIEQLITIELPYDRISGVAPLNAYEGEDMIQKLIWENIKDYVEKQ